MSESKSQLPQGQEEINVAIEQIATLLARSGDDENFEAAQLITPTTMQLRSYLDHHGLDQFLELIAKYYFQYPSIAMKEVIVTLMSEAASSQLRQKTLLLEQKHVHFLVTISLRHAKQALGAVLRAALRSPSEKVIVFQNLRMGGMYPPFEADLNSLLQEKGFPVFEVNLDALLTSAMTPAQVVETMKEVLESQAYQDARIILTRFKISSAPNPQDSEHPDDFQSMESQANKITALYALAQLEIVKGKGSRLKAPILMLDASKNKLSLAQEKVDSLFIQKINALDLMTIPFFYHHLFWIAAYGLDNIEDLLPASSAQFSDGHLYHDFAQAMAESLAQDPGFWQAIYK